MPTLTPLYLSRLSLSLSLCRLHSEIHPCFSVFLFTLISRTPSPAVVLSPFWLGNISVPFISLNAVPLPPPPKILAHRAKVRPSIEPRLSLSLSSPLLSLSLPCSESVSHSCTVTLHSLFENLLRHAANLHVHPPPCLPSCLWHLPPLSPTFPHTLSALPPLGDLPDCFMSTSSSPLPKRL